MAVILTVLMVLSSHGVSEDPGLFGADFFLGIGTTAIVQWSWMTLFKRFITEISGAYHVFEALSGCTK